MRARGHNGAKSRRIAAALAATFLIVAACGSDDDDGGGGSDSGEDTSTEFTYWSMWQEDEPQAKVLKAVFASFEEETGITVNVEWQGRDNITKLVAALRTQDVPDLVDGQFFALQGSIVNNDQHTDLSDVYDMDVAGEDATVREVIPDKYNQFTTTEDGQQFMVPYEVLAYSIWYDGKALPELADAPPEDWGAFMDLVADRKAAGSAPVALDGDIGGYNEYWTATALIRALGSGGLEELITDEQAAGWEDPAVLSAIESVAELADGDYFIPGFSSSKWPAIQNKWAAHEADFLFMGSWAPTETAEVADDGFEYRSFNFPRLGDDYSVPASVIGFSVPGNAEHADAAKEFMAYFLAADQLEGIATDASNLTPRTDIDPPQQLADVKALIDSEDITKINDGVQADHPDYSTEVFQPLSQKLLAGSISADEFISQIVEDQQRYWETQG